MSGRVERYGWGVATKRYLYTPGPTPVPPEVLAAVGAPVLHHRSPDFLPVYERVLNRLREVCRTETDVLLFGASGTGAFESAVANLVSPGERHLDAKLIRDRVEHELARNRTLGLLAESRDELLGWLTRHGEERLERYAASLDLAGEAA